MLKIINALRPFFEDNYRRINVREYSRIGKISPPTASKLLKSLKKENLLKEEIERGYNYYFANKESMLFIDLSRIYWYIQIKNSGLLDFFERELINPVIILFGSLSKAEAKSDSDIDLAIFTISKKELDLKKFKIAFKRDIQIFMFQKRGDVKNPELLNNILNGCKISGSW